MTCPHCQGRGFVYNGSAEVRRGTHGRLELCSCVECGCGGRHWLYDAEVGRRQCPCQVARMRMRRLEQQVAASDIPERFRWTYRDAWQPPGSMMVQAVGRLVEAKEPLTKGLFLHGSPGTGKTMLACILLNELMLHRRHAARFVNLTRQLFPRLRDTFSEESKRHGQSLAMLEQLERVHYLVLDDMGVERGTEWEEEILYHLVDARYAEQRFTVVTSNVADLEEIREISRGRVYSRLQEMCTWVELKGPDRREAAG